MKKVLLISYYWPPAGGPGALRMVKFARYLPQFGWQPVVLTVKNGEFPYRDPSLEEDLPPGIKVYRSNSWDPFRLYKKLTGKKTDEAIPVGVLTHRKRGFAEKFASAIRANLFIPDARIGWVPFAVHAALRIIKKERIDLIFISSPPHSAQLIGWWLKRICGIPWVADLRDPWTEIRYYEFVRRWKIACRLDRFLEKKVLQNSDSLTTVSRDLAHSFAAKSGQPNDAKFFVLPNGYDEADFEHLAYHPGKSFTILHTGNMQAHQNPKILWQVLKRMIDQEQQFRKIIRVRLVGKTHPDIGEEITRLGLNDVATFDSFKPHKEILPLMKNADLLLMVIPKVERNRGIVTGKFFEYLGANRSVFIIGPPDSEAGKILQSLRSGQIFDYEDEENLRSYLEQAIQSWRGGNHAFNNRPAVEIFSRKNLSRQLSEIFLRIIDGLREKTV